MALLYPETPLVYYLYYAKQGCQDCENVLGLLCPGDSP